ncbi:hypothetical protein KIN20_003274 [Parelaphostrongylus tenuis]|uniref:Uncharacterized protein n=1 Tax=Parelaphostrongylus tenuis TaxID=148309 RepID=A0AAD5QDL4_PARTN|nr:hypothetical protein KIN20_003274 [Parelaphostrongylus tenuis]
MESEASIVYCKRTLSWTDIVSEEDHTHEMTKVRHPMEGTFDLKSRKLPYLQE